MSPSQKKYTLPAHLLQANHCVHLISNRPYWEVDLGDDASVFKVEIDSHTASNDFSRNIEVQLLSKDDVVLANILITSFGTSQTKTITAHKDGAYHFERNHCIKKCQEEANKQLEAEQTKWRNAQVCQKLRT